MTDVLPLEAEIRRRIAAAGPMPVNEYMTLCLTDGEHGYYTTRDPLGARGDFITAPEVSQMFGEMIGLWMAAVWKQMGSPENLRVIELGPGRGTMMKDALRAAKVMPDFREAVVMHLVEISPALEAQQERTLEHLSMPMYWHPALNEVPKGPAIVVANEFFDALPVHQAVKIRIRLARTPGRDRPRRQPRLRRRAGSAAAFRPPTAAGCAPAPPGSIFEWRADNVAMELGQRLARDGGAALVIDYGHAESAAGDTLQAVGQHAFADPLTAPGQYRSHRACRFPGVGKGGRSHGRQRLRPAHASASSCAGSASRRVRHRSRPRPPAPRRRHRRGAGAPDRRGPRRHGYAVQGRRLRAPCARRAARIRDLGLRAAMAPAVIAEIGHAVRDRSCDSDGCSNRPPDCAGLRWR